MFPFLHFPSLLSLSCQYFPCGQPTVLFLHLYKDITSCLLINGLFLARLGHWQCICHVFDLNSYHAFDNFFLQYSLDFPKFGKIQAPRHVGVAKTMAVHSLCPLYLSSYWILFLPE